MNRALHRYPSSTRRKRRYIALLILVVALFAGWSWFWNYASARSQVIVDGWRAREAEAGRVYACGSQTIGGYPFRFEVNCEQASAQFRSSQPPLELTAAGLLVAMQVYDPTLLIGEIHGPLTVADPGQPSNIVVNWKLFQMSVRGTPRAPERVSAVVDRPAADRVNGGNQQNLLRAGRIEIHGRFAEGSVTNKPVIEMMLRLSKASAPSLHAAAVEPVDADITAVLRGLQDFAPKPWPARFREVQAGGGGIEITQARVQQGETVAVGNGNLSINGNGRLEGTLRVTVAGVDAFLNSIGAQQMVRTSPKLDKIAGALDRLAPGLGDVARQQAGANISLGLNLLGEQTMLEGKRAIIVPLRISDGAVFLGPIPIGDTPPLF
jgi:hypothetical protein